MRGKLETWLNRVWYSQEPPPLWLRALVPLYRGAYAADRKIKKSRASDLDNRAILVVGNLTVGGSGKTPLVIRLCKVLQEAGMSVGVASRGYGRQGKGLVVVTPDSDPSLSGDEPLLISQRARVPVVVSADRSEAARLLFGQGADVVICDDGLQHHRLPRSMEICVIDGTREFGNGFELPAGPLRESLDRLQEVDFVVVNGNHSTSGPVPDSVAMQLVPGMLKSLNENLSWRLSQFKGCRVSAVAGIANPERFFTSLEQSGLAVDRHVWPDHHVYREADFAALDANYPIIMTEKDAVKCRGISLRNAWYLAVDAQLPADFELAVAQGMMAAVKGRTHPAQ